MLISNLAMELLREIVHRSTAAQIEQPPHPSSPHGRREGRYAPLGYTPPSLHACAASGERQAAGSIDDGAPPSVAAAMSGLLRLLRSDAHTFPPRGTDDAPLEGGHDYADELLGLSASLHEPDAAQACCRAIHWTKA